MTGHLLYKSSRICLLSMYSQIEAPADVPADEEAKSEKKKMLSYLYDCVGRIFGYCGAKK